MIAVLLLLCVALGVAIYFKIVRPFTPYGRRGYRERGQ